MSLLFAAACSGSMEARPVQRTPVFQSELSVPSVVREETVCKSLEGARFDVEDVAGGVLITIRPAGDADLDDVHAGARYLDAALNRAGNMVPSRAGEQDCDLDDLAVQTAGATFELTSRGARVRIAAAPEALEDLREEARDFVDELKPTRAPAEINVIGW